MIKFFLSLISVFTLIQACSFIDTEKSQIISAQAFNKSKDVAMESAYREALRKIDEVGCDQDKGKGNVTYKKSGSGYMAEARYVIPKKNCDVRPACKDQGWTKATRAQFGGYLAHLGLGVGKSRDEADKLAKTEALKHLALECDIKNGGYRFVERCEEFSGESFIVYTRVSMNQNECKRKH